MGEIDTERIAELQMHGSLLYKLFLPKTKKRTLITISRLESVFNFMF